MTHVPDPNCLAFQGANALTEKDTKRLLAEIDKGPRRAIGHSHDRNGPGLFAGRQHIEIYPTRHRPVLHRSASRAGERIVPGNYRGQPLFPDQLDSSLKAKEETDGGVPECQK